MTEAGRESLPSDSEDRETRVVGGELSVDGSEVMIGGVEKVDCASSTVGVNGSAG